MTEADTKDPKQKCGLDEAVKLTGFGIYNLVLLAATSCMMMGMYIDMLSFSVIMPAIACDMELTTTQRSLLSAIPLIGVMLFSYVWGLCADTKGRKTTLLLAMPLGMFFNLAASMAPEFWSLTVIKFISTSFTSSANAAGFVLIGESVPSQYRSTMMYIMVTCSCVGQAVIALFALPIFGMSFYIDIPWLGLVYRPWRLLMKVICIPGLLGIIFIFFTKESPMFLLCKGKEEEAMDVLRTMYSQNTGKRKEAFPITNVYLTDDVMVTSSTETSVLRKMWNQTAPLFRPPLLVNSVKLYYILFCGYMISSGYTMWVPTLVNVYFNGGDTAGKTFCEVASTSIVTKNSTVAADCDNTIEAMTLYATMIYSVASGVINMVISMIVPSVGKKITTNIVFAVCLTCGVSLHFIKIPILSIIMFFMWLYICLILGNINTYLVDLNPTYLRGMASCLSVVVARGFGFVSVQVIGKLIVDHCTTMTAGYQILLASGFLVSFLLPPKTKKEIPSDSNNTESQDSTDPNKV